MLVLKRKEGQWVEITHKSGDTIRIRVYNVRSRFPGQLDMAFEDEDRNFEIQRPERSMPLPGEAESAGWLELESESASLSDEGCVHRRDEADREPLKPLARFLPRRTAAAPGRIRRST